MSSVASSKRCQHLSALGRRCRERRSDTHPSLCPHHARQEEQKRNDDPAALAADLLGPVQEFYTSMSVNYVTGNLLVLTASDRIPPRKAAVLAYICQLLLQSQREAKIELNAPPPALAPLIRKVYDAAIARHKAEDPSFWEDSPDAASSPSPAAASSSPARPEQRL